MLKWLSIFQVGQRDLVIKIKLTNFHHHYSYFKAFPPIIKFTSRDKISYFLLSVEFLELLPVNTLWTQDKSFFCRKMRPFFVDQNLKVHI